MEVPLGVQITVLVLSAAAVFALAARELVAEWVTSFFRFLLRSAASIPKQVAKGFARNGMHIPKPKARQPV